MAVKSFMMQTLGVNVVKHFSSALMLLEIKQVFALGKTLHHS